MATISPLHTTPFHTTPFHPVGSRAFRWLLLFVWAAALSGGPLLGVGSAQTSDDHYECATTEDGDMRLGASGHTHTGTVEICHEEQWRFVCDDKFGEEEAKVVCSHLNRNDSDIPALPAFSLSNAGGLNPYAFTSNNGWNDHPGPNKWWLDDVVCEGTEDSLADCDHRDWGQFNCGAPERVGVYCGAPPISLSVDKTTIAEGGTATVTFTVTDTDYVIQPDPNDLDKPPTYVSFRFSGSTAAQGDFFFNGRHPTNNAMQLSLALGEDELTATIRARTDSAAEGAETITVSAFYLGLAVSETITITAQEDPDIIGQEGDLRLLDTKGIPTQGQGRVQIYHAGQWGNICGRGFHDTDTFSLSSAGDYDAHVACKQLGYETGTLWNYASDAQGLLSERVWLSDLYCREDDSRLVECGRGVAWERAYCHYYDSAGVDCTGERSNQPPVPPLTISGRTHMQAEAFSYEIDPFTDPEDQTLTYTAELEDGGVLPSWLSFNPASRTFAAVANAANAATVGVRVTATDPGEDENPATADDNLSASVVFTILVITSGNRDSIVGRASRSPDEHDASRVETYTLPPQDSAGSSAGSRTLARNTDSAVTWSLDRSEEFCDDADQFTIAPDATDSDRATLTFREPPDYENPADCNMDNTYVVTVRATRGSDTFTRQVTVTVQNVDDVLMVVEGGGYVENDTEEPVTLELTGVSDPVAWRLVRNSNSAVCDDADQFTIASDSDSDRATLTFTASPDYEDPADCDMDNTYEVTVEARAGGNTFERTLTISVADRNDPPTFADNQVTSFDVPENSESSVLIGTVEANDPEGDSPTYSLDDDSGFFTINDSGELRPTAAAAFDHEKRSSYRVTVLVSDGKDANGKPDEDEGPDAELDVTIHVIDVNEEPTFADDQASFKVPENRSSVLIGTVEADDPEGDSLTYSLAGDGNKFFTINNRGELRPKAALDYEQPEDEDNNNRYEVTVLVSDRLDPDGDEDDYTDDRLPVTITVEDEKEDGTVSLDPDPPQALAPLMATLNDPDRDPHHLVTWTWERSENDTGPWDIINGESEARYTPSLDDTGDFLRATASYNDRLSSNQTAEAVSAKVKDAPLVGLRLSSNDIAEGGTTEVTAMLPLNETVGVDTVVTLRDSPAFTRDRDTLTIPANMTESTDKVPLTAEDNAVDEGDRRVRVRGDPSANSQVAGVSWATLTIIDDDTRGVTVTPDTLSILEEGNATYTVKLNSEPTGPVTVAITSNNDKVEVDSSELTFQPNNNNWSREQSVTVTVKEDSDAADEQVVLTHTATGGDYSESATVTVNVDDKDKSSDTVRLEVDPKMVREGSSQSVTVTGTLNGATRTAPTVVLVLVAPDDDLEDDVTFATLTIEAGQQSGSMTFTPKPIDDDLHERNETVMVGGTISPSTLGLEPTTLIIEDGDGPPTVELELMSASIPEGGESPVLVTLTHESVELTTVMLPETQDYTLSRTTLTIPARGMNGEVTLTAENNTTDEKDKQVTVSGGAENDLGVTGPKSVNLTITDDDPPEVTGDNAPEYVEGETGPVATYTASNPDTRNISIGWSLDGTDKDAFTILDGVLRFNETPDHEDPNKRDQRDVEVIATATDGRRPSESFSSTPFFVTVEVMDALGTLSLEPDPAQEEQTVTATLADPDDIDDTRTITWTWEWALNDEAQDFEWQQLDGHTDDGPARTSTLTLSRGTADRHLRVTANYIDGAGTRKASDAVQIISDAVQPAEPRPDTPRRPSGGPPSGGPPSGGGGGPACAEDRHGNQPTQATALALDTVTAGAICPAADVDYFTLTAPGQGLVFVDTTGGVQTRGTIWQNDEVLASGSTGRQPDARLGARVEAGDVVVAVQGQGGATGAYAVEITFVQGHLENPGVDSFQSGVGVLSGWVCDAGVVEIELNGMPQEAAYGTERGDTAGVCGDTDNGFGLLFNWNLLEDGAHDVVALVDGVELDRATVTVTTLGEEFVTDAVGETAVEDFPSEGETVRLVWQQANQNFVLASEDAGPVVSPSSPAGGPAGALENPGPASFQSGIGLLSGWVCEAAVVELEINGGARIAAAYGTERADTAARCGDTDNGFGLLFNWNLLGDGVHTVVAVADDAEFGRATFTVTTLDVEFLQGMRGEAVVTDFPSEGKEVWLIWQEANQNFVIADVE